MYILFSIFLILLNVLLLSHIIKEILDIFPKRLFTKKSNEDDYFYDEDEIPTSPMWNIKDFRERMKDIVIDEDMKFTSPPEGIDDSGAEIVTEDFEREFERRYL